MAGDDYEALIAHAMAKLRAKNEAMIHQTQLCDDACCRVDQNLGKIIFTQPDGARLSAPVQFVGTYDLRQGMWLWAWSNPAVYGPLRQHAQTIRRYGAVRRIPELMTPAFECLEDDCWRFTALACFLNGAESAFRGPGAHAYWFMTLGMFDRLEAA